MKILSFASALIFLIMLSSCKKDSQAAPPGGGVEKNIRYVLYTDKDFSTDNEDILFSVFIKDANNNLIWDSALAPMKVNEIPSLANSIVVEKSVLAINSSLLRVGFTYVLPNVGDSWYIDTCNAGSTLKVVNFNFR